MKIILDPPKLETPAPGPPQPDPEPPTPSPEPGPPGPPGPPLPEPTPPTPQPQPPRRVDLKVLAAGDVHHSGNRRLVLRTLGPLGDGSNPEAVALAHLLAGDRLPEALRRRLDVDLEHGHAAAPAHHRVGLLVVHRSFSSFSISLFSSVRAEAHGAAYLLTQRSWISRIGTGLRKCSFSRPRFRVVTSPASSSTFRCFMTPKRVIGNRSSKALSVCPSCSKS